MKQLLPISKKSKQDSKKTTLQRLSLSQPDNQQHNFIYQEHSDQDGDKNVHELVNNEPSVAQILFYAQTLGIKLPQEQDLLYIAKQCLNAQMPPGWHCQTDEQGEIIYINDISGQRKFEHPSDQVYRQKVIVQRKKKIQNLMKALPKTNKPKSKTSFLENVFNEKPQVIEVEQKKYKPIEQKKSLSVVINEGLNNIKAKDRRQNIKDNIGKNSSISQTLPKLDFKKDNEKIVEINKQKSEYHVDVSRFNKKANPEVLEQKKRLIKQKMQRKYKDLISQQQKKYVNKLKLMKQKQQTIKNMSMQSVQQLIGENIIERKRKQIEMKLMMQHATEIEKKRLERQKQYRKQILFLSSKYQIDELFTQMAQCRKFINRQKKQSQKPKYFQQMQQNIKIINQIQIEKIIAEIQRQSRTVMHEILNKILDQHITHQMDWQKQYQITDQFNSTLEKIINQYSKKQKPLQIETIKQPEEKIIKESLQLYQQMENLKKKLRQLQEQNSTHRSNLSEKQSKLVDLLQNRASSSARSSQHS